MPLKYKDSSAVCETVGNNLETAVYSEFKDSSKLLHGQPLRQCSPPGVLYVDQRELAVTTVDDEFIHILGSDDATTCHIAVLRHTGSGATGICHFDSCGTTQGVKDLVDRVSELTQGTDDGRLELHIVGGFKDDRGSSEELSKSLLNLNNTLKDGINFPAIYGMGVSVKTGEIFPATFDYKGPDKAVRSLRHFIGDRDIKNIYNHTEHQLKIGPYHYSHNDFPDAALFLKQSDWMLRQFLSTSPAVEPPQFTQQVREALSFLLANPSSQTVFPHGLSHMYKMRKDGLWEPAI